MGQARLGQLPWPEPRQVQAKPIQAESTPKEVANNFRPIHAASQRFAFCTKATAKLPLNKTSTNAVSSSSEHSDEMAGVVDSFGARDPALGVDGIGVKKWLQALTIYSVTNRFANSVVDF